MNEITQLLAFLARLGFKGDAEAIEKLEEDISELFQNDTSLSLMVMV